MGLRHLSAAVLAAVLLVVLLLAALQQVVTAHLDDQQPSLLTLQELPATRSASFGEAWSITFAHTSRALFHVAARRRRRRFAAAAAAESNDGKTIASALALFRQPPSNYYSSLIRHDSRALLLSTRVRDRGASGRSSHLRLQLDTPELLSDSTVSARKVARSAISRWLERRAGVADGAGVPLRLRRRAPATVEDEPEPTTPNQAVQDTPQRPLSDRLLTYPQQASTSNNNGNNNRPPSVHSVAESASSSQGGAPQQQGNLKASDKLLTYPGYDSPGGKQKESNGRPASVHSVAESSHSANSAAGGSQGALPASGKLLTYPGYDTPSGKSAAPKQPKQQQSSDSMRIEPAQNQNAASGSNSGGGGGVETAGGGGTNGGTTTTTTTHGGGGGGALATQERKQGFLGRMVTGTKNLPGRMASGIGLDKIGSGTYADENGATQ
ncbi:hypothetical protein HK405_010547, partial [Cladochytrium tenue]